LARDFWPKIIEDQKMRIAFLGLKDAFDYYKIGGVESFIRRITYQMTTHFGINIDYILYGAQGEKMVDINPKLKLRYFKRFEHALSVINAKYDHVITVYLFPKDKLKYAYFRRKNKNLSFHKILFSWSDNPVWKSYILAEAKIFPYNGQFFCISERQYECVKKWMKNVVYILPPVPKDFFIRPEEKPNNKKIKLTFLGRIDPGKGILDVIKLFVVLKENSRLQCTIYGIYLQNNKKSVAIRNWLKNQRDIKYVEIDRENHSPLADEMVKNVFKETDILILPYKTLGSTIDTPVTLLEAMASLCAVITKPFGNIPDIYGKTKFIIPKKKFLPYVINFFENLTTEKLRKERKRIYKQNQKLNFATKAVVKKFLAALNG